MPPHSMRRFDDRAGEDDAMSETGRNQAKASPVDRNHGRGVGLQ